MLKYVVLKRYSELLKMKRKYFLKYCLDCKTTAVLTEQTMSYIILQPYLYYFFKLGNAVFHLSAITCYKLLVFLPRKKMVKLTCVFFEIKLVAV